MDKFVKPVSEALVRDPATMAILPADGMIVPWTGPLGRYWRRRLRDGSITEGKKKVSETSSKYSSRTKEEVNKDGN